MNRRYQDQHVLQQPENKEKSDEITVRRLFFLYFCDTPCCYYNNYQLSIQITAI